MTTCLPRRTALTTSGNMPALGARRVPMQIVTAGTGRAPVSVKTTLATCSATACSAVECAPRPDFRRRRRSSRRRGAARWEMAPSTVTVRPPPRAVFSARVGRCRCRTRTRTRRATTRTAAWATTTFVATRTEKKQGLGATRRTLVCVGTIAARSPIVHWRVSIRPTHFHLLPRWATRMAIALRHLMSLLGQLWRCAHGPHRRLRPTLLA